MWRLRIGRQHATIFMVADVDSHDFYNLLLAFIASNPLNRAFSRTVGRYLHVLRVLVLLVLSL